MKRRNTPSKQAILDILKSSEGALSQESIEKMVNGTMDRVTVYRVLNSFCDDGMVHRIASDDGRSYFAICMNCEEKHHRHNHFHFRCVKCQRVECMKEEVHVTIPEGYSLQNMNCLLTGHCRSCA